MNLTTGLHGVARTKTWQHHLHIVREPWLLNMKFYFYFVCRSTCVTISQFCLNFLVTVNFVSFFKIHKMRAIKKIKQMMTFFFHSIKIQVYKSRYVHIETPLASFLYFFYTGADLNPFSWDNRSLLYGLIVQKQHLVASHTWTRQPFIHFLYFLKNFFLNLLFLI